MLLLSGNIILIDRILCSCPIKIDDKELTSDLIEFDMLDFELILRIDWLSRYHVSFCCNKKAVIFQSLDFKKFMFFDNTDKILMSVISTIKSRKLLNNECEDYLTNILDISRK